MKYSVMSNAAWMMSEKVVSVFGVIFVTSYVAKSFGPVIFGQIAFSASLFSIIQTIAIFGTETILFKSISKSTPKGMRLMGVAKSLRLTLLLVLSLPVLLYVWLTMRENFIVFAVASFLSAMFVTQDIFSVYNNARLESRMNTVANATGMILSFAISFTVAWCKLSPLWLSLSIVAVTLVPYLIKRSRFYQTNTISPPPRHKRKNYLRYLLHAGLPLAISSVFIAVQVKTAQFFLVGVSSAQDLGLFTAANTISASWIFIPVAIITSCFSEIFRERADVAVKLASRLNGYVMAVSLLMLSVVTLFGDRIINSLYGQDYTQSGNLITLLSLATCFSAMGTVAYRYMVKEGGFNYLLVKVILLVVIGLATSYFFIHSWGLTGAAWSVFITELLSLTIMNYFFKNGVILKIQLSSLNYKTYR
ncbi:MULTISPECIES: polysaccharide biosynthesis protein [Erwinia]|uniref:O-antigen/teichoic acid export membrane protein n=1 Tax=Erwinia rhapontici TaxID=55212 RepID=A0ABM7N5X5_ERWRD|nr:MULTISPECIES: polysaccharide biosynthesis protein [Erwinia]MBP2153003.1 O-antigen/teichoic acid export membrane protein [Erwinia rhapontici]MCS3608342.1 O-antigen/teichoic acid export membrane protein [Erwinia rhapontici]NKG31535.1 polysaccharide biosynthesis protein [Erwinia rhapontici]NNS08265.1 polysaccharide biosynthesis protein [Erwinia sp. JH02]TDT00811.1 O-antigen/teichoic acid export membrane protein [Erwinia rhapontici]